MKQQEFVRKEIYTGAKSEAKAPDIFLTFCQKLGVCYIFKTLIKDNNKMTPTCFHNLREVIPRSIAVNVLNVGRFICVGTTAFAVCICHHDGRGFFHSSLPLRLFLRVFHYFDGFATETPLPQLLLGGLAAIQLHLSVFSLQL